MIRVTSVLAVLSCVLGFSTASVAAPQFTGKLELGQSVPSETHLEQSDIPFAKDVWVEMIREAKTSIDLGQFYATANPAGPGGEALEAVIQELRKKGEAGVKIRMIVSNVMLKDSGPTLERLKEIKNLTIGIYDLSKVTGGIIHAKYIIVDGRELYLGSQNFDWRALVHIHETGVRTNDAESVARLSKIFETDWNFIQTGKFDNKPGNNEFKLGSEAVQLVASPPQLLPEGVPYSLDALLKFLDTAKHRISVQVMSYYVYTKGEDWLVIENALKAAARRGVVVQLMVGSWENTQKRMPHLKALAQTPGISVRMVTIPDHSSGPIPYARVIHSKLLTVDEQVAWIGTSNWAKEYFEATRGVELIAHVPAIAKQTQRIFDRLWTSPMAQDVKRVVIPTPAPAPAPAL